MISQHILLADDENTFRETFTSVLEEEGFSVTAVSNGTDAINALLSREYPLALLDIQMPGADGIKVLCKAMKMYPKMRVIMVTAFGSVEMAVEAIKLGACDYVMKPVVFDDILSKIRQQLQVLGLEAENKALKDQLESQYGLGNIIGKSPIMQTIFDSIKKVAQTNSNILITGQSGTGKELVARAIHSTGISGKNRFVGVNCSAIPEQLLESELFGHKKGSFTSAVSNKKGLFETADGGTLFLDEIGYMPLNCQVKLLRAIEERQIMPIGANEPINFDLRIIAAMNKDPLDEVHAGRFREDLFYRLNVVGISLPSLSERKEDVPILVNHFIQKYNMEMGKCCQGVTESCMEIMINHEWKGNVRELQNVIERAIIFSENNRLTESDIGIASSTQSNSPIENENLNAYLRQCEKEHLERILSRYNANKSDAAKALGVGLSSLYRKLDMLKLS
ncbi:MAG: sigma-54 dependent transcriptional regulator [Phycisphaerae bacterium]|nr:sigma-54 dependent transcriptional regulator [Phycisphaerae bacterium]